MGTKTSIAAERPVPLTFTGSFNPPDPTTGRGTGTFTDSSPATSSFNYYIVDANNVRFLAADINVIGQGRAELQSGTPALSGSYAFGSKGDTSASLSGVNMAGRFTASGRNYHRRRARLGAGRQHRHQRQLHRNLYPGRQRPRRGNSHHGREQQPGGVDGQSRRAAFSSSMIPIPSRTEASTCSRAASFSNSTMNGQFGFVMDGFDTGGAKDRVGTLQWDGSGKLILNEFTNAGGHPQHRHSVGKLCSFGKRTDRRFDQQPFQQSDFLSGLGQ